MRALVPSVLLALALSACGASARELGPERAIADLARSLRAGAGDDADGRERLALADELERAPVRRIARITLRSEEDGAREVSVALEGERFRVEAGVLGAPLLDTPEQAIAALHRALVREIALGPGSLLSDDERGDWLEERERYRDGTALPEALDVRLDGDSASVTTPLGDAIELVREGREWRVRSMRAAGLD